MCKVDVIGGHVEAYELGILLDEKLRRQRKQKGDGRIFFVCRRPHVCALLLPSKICRMPTQRGLHIVNNNRPAITRHSLCSQTDTRNFFNDETKKYAPILF